jgi:hypothetical protein
MTDKKTVAGRVEQEGNCRVINLGAREAEIYSAHHTRGLRLIYFVDGELRELFDPDSDTREEAMAELQEWFGWTLKTGEVWMADCQNFKLHELRRVTQDDPTALEAAKALVGGYFD